MPFHPHHRLTRLLRATVLPLLLLAGMAFSVTAVRSDDWTSLGSDAQRSSWVRADHKTSTETVRAPGFRFLWKMSVPNEARSGNALTAPALLDFLISHRGFRSLAFFGSSSGGVFAVDTDLARTEWERHFLPGPSRTSPDCPGGMTANVTRPTAAAMPSALGFLARGRRSPAKSAVGNPSDGAVTLVQALPPAPSGPAPRAAGTSRVRPPARYSLRGVTLVYALSADGMLHALYASNGTNRVPPLSFVPANANARGLIVVDDVAYVTTANGCNGIPDAVWSLDIESGEVRTWESDEGSVVGPAGVAFSPDGTLFAATRNGPLVALEAGSLTLKTSSRVSGFRSSPVVFDHDGEDRVAAIAVDGSIKVFDAHSLDEIASATLAGGPPDSETALATWRDRSGTQWILAPSRRSVAAWKVLSGADGTRIETGWDSPAMDSPLPPIVVNGVVFALDGRTSSGSAKLYALEGTSGERLWDSGDTILSTATGHTLAAGPGHVFLTTSDSSLYTFGFPMEH